MTGISDGGFVKDLTNTWWSKYSSTLNLERNYDVLNNNNNKSSLSINKNNSEVEFITIVPQYYWLIYIMKNSNKKNINNTAIQQNFNNKFSWTKEIAINTTPITNTTPIINTNSITNTNSIINTTPIVNTQIVQNNNKITWNINYGL